MTSAPRDAGDKNPAAAAASVAAVAARIWTPAPTRAASVAAPGGGRNASPATAFHPPSSPPSLSPSPPSTASYRARSRRTVRAMIQATSDEVTRTTAREFRMESQCTDPAPPGARRYASHRVAHVIALSSQNTSYVYATRAPGATSWGGGIAPPPSAHGVSVIGSPGDRAIEHASTSNPTIMNESSSARSSPASASRRRTPASTAASAASAAAARLRRSNAAVWRWTSTLNMRWLLM